MEKADALLYLNLDDDQDLNEAYENQLFKFKQFFLSNVPTTKTFSAKWNRVKKIQEAYDFLGGQEVIDNSDNLTLLDFDTKEVAQLFRIFQENNNRIKLKITACSNAQCLINSSRLLIGNLSRYANLWAVNLQHTDESILITKEPDSIELLKAIKAFNDKGYSRFDEIEKLEPDNSVYRESIRLSLWLKMENNDRSI